MNLAATTRRQLVRSMRACTESRLPYPVKALYIHTLRRALPATDEPTESEYGTRFLPGNPLNTVLEYRGVHDPTLSEFIRQHVRPGDMCVDAGANIGYFSVLLAQQVGPEGKVISIEASPPTAEKLRANIALNKADIVVVEAAITSEPGEVTFHLHPSYDLWSRISPPPKDDPDRNMGQEWTPVTVRGDTLSAILGDDVEKVSFIKVDIEGAETAAAPEIAAFPHPNLVVALEVESPTIQETLKPFQDNGFYLYDLHNDYRWICERTVPKITETTYNAVIGRSLVNVLVSRQKLAI